MDPFTERTLSEVLCAHILSNIEAQDELYHYVAQYMTLEDENQQILSGMKQLGIPVMDEYIASHMIVSNDL